MENRKKVFALDIRLLGKKRTGDETVFFHLTKEILSLDTENHFVLLTDETDPKKLDSLLTSLSCKEKKNVTLVSLFARNRFSWNLFILPWYLFTHHIDIFHTQYILPFLVPRRTNVVLHIHDVSFCAYPKLISLTDRFFLWFFIPRSLRRATVIITPSSFTRDEIIKYYSIDKEKIVVIPNALGDDFLQFNVDENRFLLIKKKYHLPEKYILYVGTLQPRKNIPFLIEAFAAVNKKVPDTKLVVVGNRHAHHVDKHLEKTIGQTSSESSVLFPGFIDQADLPLVVRGASVFVFPSLYEGFGIPLLEAMSQQVPVAASDIPVFREIANDAALYFSPSDLAICEKTLYTLLIDKQQREVLIKLGKDRVSSFSWLASARLLLQAYKQFS
ncbi:MAG: glycosyltransferase family 4 protein [Candidatus Moranbacteria bacterium]|nr:glycosyltransferase family 4 protein [Candidatus Moranbacteria bacterium]